MNSTRLGVGCLVFAAMLAITGGGTAQEDPGPSGEDYVIGVGEILSILVWKNEELSVTVPVRPDGWISLPLVGEVEAAGRTPFEVREALNEDYEAYLTSPAVSVVVEQINSRKVYIMGEVNSAGVYDIVQPTRLLQALAMAGGLTDFAKKDQVILLRDVGPDQTRTVLSIKEIQSGRKLEDNVRLRPGDTIIVP